MSCKCRFQHCQHWDDASLIENFEICLAVVAIADQDVLASNAQPNALFTDIFDSSFGNTCLTTLPLCSLWRASAPLPLVEQRIDRTLHSDFVWHWNEFSCCVLHGSAAPLAACIWRQSQQVIESWSFPAKHNKAVATSLGYCFPAERVSVKLDWSRGYHKAVQAATIPLSWDPSNSGSPSLLTPIHVCSWSW